MNVLLNEHEWEGHEEEDEGFHAVSTGDRSYSIPTIAARLGSLFCKAKRKRSAVEDAQEELQGSEQEMSQPLKDKHIFTIDREFFPQPPSRNVLDKN
jgi:hypothetical protein